MWPFILFGVVIYWGVRTVLERQPEKQGPAPNPVPGLPGLPTVPTAPSAPVGWPSTYSFTDCEKFMAALPKETVKTYIDQAIAMSDDEWALRKAQPGF